MNTLLPFSLPDLARSGRVCAALLGLGSLLAAAPGSRAQSVGALTSLYSFSATDANGLNRDGSNPVNLILASDGNFYGVTYQGGSSGKGSVFRLTPAGQLTPLYSFAGGSDGANPFGHLTDGGDGFLYGTTTGGGNSAGAGTTYRISLSTGAFTLLTQFGGNPDGAPYSPLTPDGHGGFYGTTDGGNGTIFHLVPQGSSFTESVVYNFSSGTDGNSPQAGVILASDGNLYGTTLGGGANGFGELFQFNPATSQLNVLYAFTSGNSTDGSGTVSPLLEGPDGLLYGTASRGGDGNNDGYVYKISKSGTFTLLYTFTGGSDGSQPYAGLIFAADGNLLGVAERGGANGTGTIFELPTAGGAPDVLYTFSAETSGINAEGYNPGAALVPNGGGYYGAAFRGGSGGSGTLFEFALHPAFFAGEAALSNGVYYLQFSSGNPFGYYSFLTNPNYIYHQDLGYEYVFDANDGKSGVYLYDFKSNDFFYTSPTFPFPYLYDFGLKSVLYYYPDPSSPGRYNTDGVRYFYDFATGQIITK